MRRFKFESFIGSHVQTLPAYLPKNWKIIRFEEDHCIVSDYVTGKAVLVSYDGNGIVNRIEFEET